MNRSSLLWTAAFVITLASAVYQRLTGPTHPLRVRVPVAGAEVRGRLQRSHPGPANHPLTLQTTDPSIQGSVVWRRYKTHDPFQRVPFVRDGDTLIAELPHQPPAGKLEYQVVLRKGSEEIHIPASHPLVIRFRGDVPIPVLIAHIVAMFGGMLLATRAGFAAWRRESNLKSLTLWTLLFLTAGGLILGPIVQNYSFGAYWTGWPYGTDLTDNKTLIAIVIWVAAYVALLLARSPQPWVVLAAVATLAVFMIPHSVLGSELDYSRIPAPVAPKPLETRNYISLTEARDPRG